MNREPQQFLFTLPLPTFAVLVVYNPGGKDRHGNLLSLNACVPKALTKGPDERNSGTDSFDHKNSNSAASPAQIAIERNPATANGLTVATSLGIARLMGVEAQGPPRRNSPAWRGTGTPRVGIDILWVTPLESVLTP